MPTTPGGRYTRRLARAARAARRPALAAAVLGAATLAVPAIASASPLKGDGMWIWELSHAGGTAESIANRANSEGYEWVAIKSGDGTDVWSQFTKDLVKDLKARDVRVCAWVFIYGEHPRQEAKMSAAAKKQGAKCLIIDAEGHYEGRYQSADKYIRKLRKRVGSKFKLGFTSFPYVDFHLSLPYSVFLGRKGADFNVPQIYWRTIGDSVRESYEHTYVWNRPYGRDIYPLGQTYLDPPKKELRNFRRHANEFGAKGVNWWAWHTTSGKEWDAAAADVGKVKGYKALGDYVHLNRGAAGDVVLQAQQLLRAHKIKVPVRGKLNGRTSDALDKFQKRKGLNRTGTLNNQTWKKLLKREPVHIRWHSKKRQPAFLSGAAASRIDVLDVELPFTPGRP
ncbi:MAG: peptidoglycan-binding domain-containing protein [Solirubrobacterales bacterium]